MSIPAHRKDTLVTAVTINHNRKNLLLNCLESIKRQSMQPDEIIVIDNGSEDGSAEAAQQQFPDINILENKQSPGFAASCNQGIRLSKGEFILLLNNDVVLDGYFIESAVTAMQTGERTGILGGKILSGDGSQLDSTGQFLARSRKIIDRGYKEANNGKYNRSGFVFGAAASAVLYRRSMLDEIKEADEYFDEDFGFFYEDMDLAWRAQKRGWKAYYEPKAVAYHRRGATTKTKAAPTPFLEKYYISHLEPGLQYYAVRNRYLMMLKNDSAKDVIRDLPFILWHEVKQACYILLFEPALISRLFTGRRSFANSLRKRKRLAHKPAIISEYKHD